MHVRFGARVAEAYLLQRRHTLTQNLREVHLLWVGRSPRRAVRCLLLDGLHDARMRMTGIREVALCVKSKT